MTFQMKSLVDVNVQNMTWKTCVVKSGYIPQKAVLFSGVSRAISTLVGQETPLVKLPCGQALERPSLKTLSKIRKRALLQKWLGRDQLLQEVKTTFVVRRWLIIAQGLIFDDSFSALDYRQTVSCQS